MFDASTVMSQSNASLNDIVVPDGHGRASSARALMPNVAVARAWSEGAIS